MRTINRLCYCSIILAFFNGCFSAAGGNEHTLPYYNSADLMPRWVSATQAATLHSIPAFSFTDQQGNTVTQKTFYNKITVVDFFFTHCPGICKRLTKNLAAVQLAFMQDNHVMLLSHTVLPAQDSVPVLQAYAKANGIVASKWRLVTGNKTQLYKIAREGYFADEDVGLQPDSSSFLHTENVLLIDKQQHIRGIYKGTLPEDILNLIADIKMLESEK